MEAPKRRGQSYNKWLGDAAKPSHKEQLRQAIDRALEQKPASLEELLCLLEQDGFTVHQRGKTISIGVEGWGNNVRFERLGDGYTLDDLLAVLSGQKEQMCIRDRYEVGLSTAQTPFGHDVPVYDMERTICDVLRSRSHIEMQTFQEMCIRDRSTIPHEKMGCTGVLS